MLSYGITIYLKWITNLFFSNEHILDMFLRAITFVGYFMAIIETIVTICIIVQCIYVLINWYKMKEILKKI